MAYQKMARIKYAKKGRALKPCVFATGAFPLSYGS